MSTYLLAQQNPQPFYHNYSTKDGLPSPEVYCAFEDSNGYMWFGTDNGVTRFDGYSFKNYGAQEGLLNNVIFHIYEDEKKRIWFGSMTGGIFVLEGDTILPYQYNHLIENFDEKYDDCSLVDIDKNETVYLAMRNYGLVRIDKKGQVDTLNYKYPNILLIANFDECQNAIAVRLEAPKTADGNLPTEEGFFSVNLVTSNNRNEILLPALEKGYSCSAQKMPNGEIIFFYGNQLFCLKDSNLLWVIPFSFPVTSIILDKNNSIWITLRNGKGARRYRNLQALKLSKYDSYLKGLSISDVYKDSKGAYWMCSQKQGIFYCPDINMLTYDKNVGLSDDFVTSVNFKNDKTLFVGLHNEDVFRINLEHNKATFLFKNLGTYHSPSLLYDNENNCLWGGNYYLQGAKNAPFSVQNNKLEKFKKGGNQTLTNLQFLKNGYLIGNAPPFGLYILDTQNDAYIYSSKKDTLKGRVYGLHADYDDRIWIGKAHGLFEFKDSSLIRPGIDHPAFYHRVESIDQLPDSSLVLGTKGYGVSIWKKDDLFQITIENGLTSNMIEDVHVSENGTLWIATLNGLNKITFNHQKKLQIRQFTVSNGLPSNEVYQINDYGGQIWLCTNKGLVQFHEKVENYTALAPNIQWVKVNGEKKNWKNNDTYHHEDKSVEISYLSINYRLDGKINYRYRINREDKWQYTQNRSVNYPSLSPNEYYFEIQAQNEDQFWSKSSHYSFTVKAPYWSSLWFQSLSLLMFLMGGYYLYRNRIEKIKQENALQNQILNLEKSALQAQMSPHFTFNCLNSIQNFILKNDKKKAVEYLSRFARLVRHNLDASIQGLVSVEEETVMLDNYLALEKERFNHRFDYYITISDELKSTFVEFPIMMVQPFVENAVIHGMANKSKGGLITIDFSKSNGRLQIIVTDNGDGFKNRAQKKQKLFHKSVGVNITKKRLALLGKNKDNRVEIEEIKNGAGAIQGTEVIVLIKI